MNPEQSKFELGYTNSRSTIVMKAWILTGLKSEAGHFVFRAQGLLPFRDDAKFRCQLHLHFDSVNEIRLEEMLRDFYIELNQREFSVRCERGIFTLSCPLMSQDFVIRKSGANPVSFVECTNLKLIPLSNQIPSGRPLLQELIGRSVKMQYWIAQHGPNSMFVPDRHEQFESDAVVSGGRPESNRKRF